jgi:hypothetical protein
MGKPAVLVFHSGAGSGCGSVLAPFGTWMGRAGAVQRVEGGVLSVPRSPSSERSGATMPKASTSAFTLDNSISFSRTLVAGFRHSGARPVLFRTSLFPVFQKLLLACKT